jgi:macrolide-specific efflux system membrane fusion protein
MEESKKSSKKKWILLIIGAMLVVALIIGFLFRRHQQQAKNLTEPIQRGTVIESVYGIGTVKATKTFDLKAGVVSSIRNLYVQEGDKVKKGAPLADFDTGSRFTAPFDGTITWVPYNVGENVFLQSVIVSLTDLNDRYMIVSLEQRGAIKVKVGQKVRINFDSMRNETYKGEVKSVYSHENDFRVRITANDLPDQILPGMTGDVAISIREHPNALIVPLAAIKNGKVEVLKNGRKKSVAVTTGVIDGAMAEITAGELQEGDRLVLQKAPSP